MQVRPCSHCCCDPRGVSERRFSGPILAPPHRKRGASLDQGLHVWVQVTRRHRWVRVARHTLDHVQRDATVRHPSQGCVPQTVTHQTRQPETSDDFIPLGGIPQRRCRDHATTRTGHEPLVTIPTGYEALKSWAQRIYDRNRSLAATFRRLGHQGRVPDTSVAEHGLCRRPDQHHRPSVRTPH